MRIPKQAWYLMAVVLAGLVIWLAWPSQPTTEAKLADGSVLHLEKVGYGRRDPFQPGGWYRRAKEQLAAHLPKSWAARLTSTNASWSSWSSSFSTVHTNIPALHVWLTRSDPASRGYQDVGVRYAEVVDEDGCVFGATASGGEDKGLLPVSTTPPGTTARPATTSFTMSGTTTGTTTGTMTTVGGMGGSGGIGFQAFAMRSSVTWFTFEVFPRRDKRFKLRLYDDQRKLLAEFKVPNPMPALPKVQAAPPLPVSVTNGDVVFTLTRASVRTNEPSVLPAGVTLPSGGQVFQIPGPGMMTADNRVVEFAFETTEMGAPSTDWDPVSMELTDGSGNLAPMRGTALVPLCPRAPLWNLTMKFVARAGSKAASNNSWTMNGVTLPEAGTTMPLSTNFVLGDLSFHLIDVGGAGIFTYSNGVVIEAGPTGGTSGVRAGGRFGRGAGSNVQTMRGTIPHMAISGSELGEGQYLTVEAVDDRGRRTYTRVGAGGGYLMAAPFFGGRARPGQIGYLGRGPRVGPFGQAATVAFLLLDVARDAKTVDLTFRLHETRKVEFVFKPPE